MSKQGMLGSLKKRKRPYHSDSDFDDDTSEDYKPGIGSPKKRMKKASVGPPKAKNSNRTVKKISPQQKKLQFVNQVEKQLDTNNIDQHDAKKPISSEKVHPFFLQSFKKDEQRKPQEVQKKSLTVPGSMSTNGLEKDSDAFISTVHELFMSKEQKKRKKELQNIQAFRDEIQKSKELDSLFCIPNSNNIVQHPLLRESIVSKRPGKSKQKDIGSKIHELELQPTTVSTDDFICWNDVTPLSNIPTHLKQWPCSLHASHVTVIDNIEAAITDNITMEPIFETEEIINEQESRINLLMQTDKNWWFSMGLGPRNRRDKTDLPTRAPSMALNGSITTIESEKIKSVDSDIITNIILRYFVNMVSPQENHLDLIDRCRYLLISFTKRNLDNDQNSTLWSYKYRPLDDRDIVGASTKKHSVNQFSLWLMHLCDKMNNIYTMTNHKNPSMFTKDNNSQIHSDLDDDQKDLVILVGPTGRGKTSCVYALANKLGFEVLEVNPSDDRSNTRILGELTEATQSHLVNKKKQLILFDEIDTKAQDQDLNNEEEYKAFLTAVRRISAFSKSPIVATCNNYSKQLEDNFSASNCAILTMSDDNLSSIVEYATLLFAISLSEGMVVGADQILSLLLTNNMDIRKCISIAQFWLQDAKRSSILEQKVIHDIEELRLTENALGIEWLCSRICSRDADICNVGEDCIWQDELNMARKYDPMFHNYLVEYTLQEGDVTSMHDDLLYVDYLSEMDSLYGKLSRQSSEPESSIYELTDHLRSMGEMLNWTRLCNSRSKSNNHVEEGTFTQGWWNNATLSLSHKTRITNLEYINLHKERKQQFQHLTRKMVSKCMGLYYDRDPDLMYTTMSICNAEQSRKLNQNKRRFFHHFGNELDDDEIEKLLSFSLTEK